MNWINLIKTDENKALSKIYIDYKDECTAWITKHTGISGDDAIDVFQVAVVILYDNIISGKLTTLTSGLKSYLFSIAKNKAREVYRKNSRHVNIESISEMAFYVDEELDAKQILESNILHANTAMNKIGDPCKSILQLYYYKRMNMEDITQLLGYKNRDTLKNQKYKCMKRLQKIYFSHKGKEEAR